MRNMTENEITAEVLKRFENTENLRVKHIATSLISHLHAFVREVELTEEEWSESIDFLTATGQKCTDTRQEFILLSDTIGVSMLVDLINHHKPGRNSVYHIWSVLHDWCSRNGTRWQYRSPRRRSHLCSLRSSH